MDALKIQIILSLIFLFFAFPCAVAATEINNNDKLSLTVEAAVNQALETDPALKTAELNLEIAKSKYACEARFITLTGKIDLNQTDDFNSYPIPSLSLDTGGWKASKTISANTLYNITGTILADDLNRNTTFSIGLTPFDRTRALSVKNSARDLAIQIEAYEKAKIDLTVKVRIAYGTAVQNIMLYQLAQDSLDLIKTYLNRTNSLFELGRVSRLDQMEAEQQVKVAELKLAGAKINKEATLLSLGVLIDRESLVDDDLAASETISWASSDKIDLEAAINQTLETASDLKVALLNIEIAKLNLASDSFYQLKGLQLSLSATKAELYKDIITSYKLSISGPIDDLYFKERYRSKMSLDSALMELKTAEINSRNEILDSFRRWKNLELNQDILQQSVDLAKEKLRIMNLKYDSGTVSGTDVIQAQQTLGSTQESYIQGIENVLEAREGFYQAVWGKPVLK